MGKIAIILTYLILVHSTDVNENRKHVHIYSNQKRLQKELAKIWIEKNGEKCIEVDHSSLDAKDEKMIMEALYNNWEQINHQIQLVFEGKNVRIIKIK